MWFLKRCQVAILRNKHIKWSKSLDGKCVQTFDCHYIMLYFYASSTLYISSPYGIDRRGNGKPIVFQSREDFATHHVKVLIFIFISATLFVNSAYQKGLICLQFYPVLRLQKVTTPRHQSHLIKLHPVSSHTHVLELSQIITPSSGENSPVDSSHYCGRENVNNGKETQLNTSWGGGKLFSINLFLVLTSQVERVLDTAAQHDNKLAVTADRLHYRLVTKGFFPSVYKVTKTNSLGECSFING